MDQYVIIHEKTHRITCAQNMSFWLCPFVDVQTFCTFLDPMSEEIHRDGTDSLVTNILILWDKLRQCDMGWWLAYIQM